MQAVAAHRRTTVDDSFVDPFHRRKEPPVECRLVHGMNGMKGMNTLVLLQFPAIASPYAAPRCPMARHASHSSDHEKRVGVTA
jgi:hypothetical protein